MKQVPVEWLHSRFVYDPEIGALRYRPTGVRRVDSRSAGKVAGFMWKRGYLAVKVQGVKFSVHRVVWAMVTGSWPVDYIDHIDGDPLNNRIENLREASNSQNQANRKPKVGPLPKGVCRNTVGFQAQIKVGGSSQYLGTFPTPEEAHEAYADAARESFGEFARVS